MTQIEALNKIENKLAAFGIKSQPRQTARGQVCFPVRYKGDGFGAVLTCIGGKPTETWWGECSPIIERRIREHFEAFQAVDAL